MMDGEQNFRQHVFFGRGVEKRVDFNMKMQKGVVFFFVYVCVCVVKFEHW